MVQIFSELMKWLPLGLPAFLFVITVVVFFHELGHFSVARAFGVGIEVFSIGFGPAIFGWTDRKGTRWKVSWIPLGGYVKFLGDADAASTPDREKLERLTAAEKATVFQTKPLYQRMLVVAAGPAANFLLAITIFTLIFMTVGREVVRPVIFSVQPHSAAASANLRPGDVVRAIDHVRIESFADLKNTVALSAGHSLAITVARDGKVLTLHATPRLQNSKDRFGNLQKIGVLGIINRTDHSTIKIVHYGFFGAAAEASRLTWFVVDRTMTYLWRMVAGEETAGELRGPVGIAQVSEQVATVGFVALVQLAALISVSIGLVNLFPVPILDGGHLLYYGYEAVMGRPLGDRAQDMGFRVGLAVMLALMVIATWNDLVRLNFF